MTFPTRSNLSGPRGRRAALRQAWFCFGVSLLSLLDDLVSHQIYREYAWQVWGWGEAEIPAN
jgi:hypothetical protein